MDLISLLAEERIKQAEANGEFRNLPGAGKPLELESMIWCTGGYADELQNSQERWLYSA